MPFGPIAAFPSAKKQLGNYFLAGFYLSRGLTFFSITISKSSKKVKLNNAIGNI
jgi:hypothetical protein